MSQFKDVEILAFDTFGTVVDWHGSIAREVQALNLAADPMEFSRAWRVGYKPAMAKVMAGELPWTRIDHLHRQILDQVLADYGIDLSEADRVHLNLAWHRLTPWADSVEGLTILARHYTTCTLSNGNLSLLANMAKHSKLPWDLILSAEVFKAYKPDPRTYLGVAELFELKPEQVMLVAAHHDDLAAARACGLRTAYIERPEEFGSDAIKDVSPQPENDLHAENFIELARLLEADRGKRL
ncbi:haloacid dehalogenase, type II [Chromatiales bacterium (ex Bugula neritina AB1)]|nr:haloacid dehalogenase, type II [Chromatiales bacterium (ex Bugula neritina AB1)]